MNILFLISAFLRPANIFNIPPGQQGVDAVGANGLIGLMANLNAYAQDMASYATSGTTAVAITANDIASNPIIQLNSGASGGYNATLPTTAAIMAALGPSVPQDGTFTKIIRIVNNNSGQTATLTAGDSPTTVVGTATVATNTCRDFAMRVMGSALVFTNLGGWNL